MKTSVVISLLGVLGFTACHSDIEAPDPTLLVRTSPSAVSDPEAWRLFDRSMSSGFKPGSKPIAIDLDRKSTIAAVKVRGGSPYRLNIHGRDGASLGFEPVDLSALGSGWHSIASNAPSDSDHIELQFDAMSALAAAPVPEIELWVQAPHLPIPASALDLTAKELPTNLLAFPPASTEDTIAPGNCVSFDLDISRPPAEFRSAYLVYETRGAFRGWGLTRSVNGLAEQTGAWLANDPQVRPVVDRFDPSNLQTGNNTVRLCSPTSSGAEVKVSDLRVVGELDTGVSAFDAITVDGRSTEALVDADPASGIDLAAGERVSVKLDRISSVDALVLGAVVTAPLVECEGSAGDKRQVAVRAKASDTETSVLALDGADACVALDIRFPLPTSLMSLDVIGSGTAERVDWPKVVITSVPEHFGNRGWVGGFVAVPSAMTGAVRVDVNDIRSTSVTGNFGTLLSRDSNDGPWPVTVVAHLPDGTTPQRQLVLDRDAKNQLDRAQTTLSPQQSTQPDTMFSRAGEKVVAQAATGAQTKIRLGTKVGLDIPAGALRQPTAITAAHLSAAGLPPLDPGMVNVTAPRDQGYEFLPHGQRFAKAIEVTVPYDPALVPKDMREEDVHTFFYDPDAKKWQQLPRNALDLSEHVARSATTHFTIMIDAVLAVPKNPTPLSFDPTALSGQVSASPAANIDMIEPPTASQTGDAHVSLPIRLPKGRGAYTPDLAIAYSSANGNGWLGVGWDLSIGHVAVDTRWGVPKFNTFDRYVLNGAELIPVDENEGPKCQSGVAGERYRTRIEGAFAHIIRCDSLQGGVKHVYHWEVVDRDGTLFVYGDDPKTDPVADPRHASLVDPADDEHIAEWNLQKVVDVHGNTTIIHYAVDVDSSVEPGQQLYPDSIAYTTSGLLPAQYLVKFQLDDGTRPDAFTSGRSGFKTSTRRLLRSVHVQFQGQPVRDYVLTYAHGQFQKTTLSSVQVYGTDGCVPSSNAFAVSGCSAAGMLDQHTFDYDQETEGFAPPVHQSLGGLPEAQVMPVASGVSAGRAGELQGGYRFQNGTRVTLGSGVSIGARQEQLGLYDMNGDGLPDQVYLDGDRVVVLYNKNAPGVPPGTHPLFDADPRKIVLGVNQMGYEGTTGWNLNAGVNELESYSGTYSESSSRLGMRFADIDGDGFLDALGHRSWFGHPCAQGTCFTDGPFGVVDSTDPYADPVLSGILDDMHHQMMLADPVIQWTAPRDGHVIVSGTAHKHQTGGADGVTVEWYVGDLLQEAVSLGASDVSTHPVPSTPVGLDVAAGDTVYLRVKTGADDAVGSDGTPLDRVDADLQVVYDKTGTGASSVTVAAPAMGDSNGSPLYSYSSSLDHRVAGSPTFVVAPVSGTLFVNGSVFKSAVGADLRACVQRFPAAAPDNPPNLDVACGGPETVGTIRHIDRLSGGPTAIAQSVVVETGQIVMVRIESDLSFDPKSVRFDRTVLDHPIVTYNSVCLPENGGVCTSDAASLSAFTFPNRIKNDFGAFVSLVPPAVEPLVAPISAQVAVNPISVDHGVIRISTDRQGTVFWFDCLESTCANVPVPLFAVTAGEALYFEIGSASGASVVNATGSFWSTPFSTPILVRRNGTSPMLFTPFQGGYHSWRFGLWNEAVDFHPTQLLSDYPDVGLLPPARQQEIASSISVPLPSFGHLSDVVPISWVGSASIAYVAADGMNAGYIGMVPDDGSAAGGGGFLAANYVRQSETKSFTLGSGLHQASGVFSTSLSINVGASDTITTTDALDVNGDGVIDVLDGDHATLGAMSTDPVGLGRLVLPPAANGLRRHHGFDYGIGLGAGVVVPSKSSSGRTLSETTQHIDYGGIGASHYVGFGVGRNETTDDLIDVNGDGLPDLIRRKGAEIKVRLNLGHRLGAEESFGTVAASMLPGVMPIDPWQARENDVTSWTNLVGIDAPNTTSDALEHQTVITEQEVDSAEWVVYSANAVKTTTWNRVTRQVADINGDGLPDLLFKRDTDVGSGPTPIIVQYNYGGTFGPPVNWETPPWDVPLGPSLPAQIAAFGLVGPNVLAGSASVTSTSHTSTLTIPIPYTNFTVGGASSTSTAPDSVELALDDVDGDGAPDHVLRVAGTPTAYVKYNEVTGQANLLRTVHRPLGGSFTLTYARTGNTVDMPHSRHVLTQVVVDDGVNLGTTFTSPDLVTQFKYDHGVYSRLEKEFFGFEKVTTSRADGVTIEDDYEVAPDQFALHGRLLHEYTRAGGSLIDEHDVAYSVNRVTDAGGNAVVGNLECVNGLPALLARVPDACTPSFPIVTQESTTHGELSGTKTHTTLTLASDYDRFGNVMASTDCGDDAIANDGIYATAAYQNDVGHWFGRATSLQAQGITATACAAGLGVGAVLRSRSGEYDSFGALVATHVDTGSGIATSTFGYDAFGNLTHVTTPPNENAQTQSYDIAYDPVAGTYSIAVTDGFGLTSRTVYDLRFGVATKETDVHDQSRTTTLDKFGRIIGVKGPYDSVSSGIAITYATSSVPASAAIVEAAIAPPGFTGPVPPSMLSTTFVDGFGRTIEENKYSVVNGSVGMVTSGLVARDLLGRVVRTQNPFFTPGVVTSFIAPQITPATTTTYDVQDRPRFVTFPDLASQSNTYSISVAPTGASLLLTRSVDPNGHARETYSDLSGRVRAFVEHPTPATSAGTSYDYLPTGELSQIIDAESHITALQYDLRGFRTSTINPDEGQIDERYDLMGNRVGHTEPNHRLLGTPVHYIYERDRLVAIEYPQKPSVKYSYGAVAAPNFGAGRVTRVADETGDRSFEYGAMGEVRRTTRTVIDTTVSPQTTTMFDFHATYDSLGRELQLIYPDGEIVSNTYDVGGQLTQVSGVGKAWSRTYVSNLRYDVFGNRTHAQFGNGDVSDWTFDPLRVRLSSLRTTLASSTPIQNLVYHYDAASNPTEIDNNLPASPVNNSLPGTSTQQYEYDGADQLVRATGNGTMGNSSTTNFTLNFTYSPSRNLTHKTLVHAVVDSASHTALPPETNYNNKYSYEGAPHLPSSIGDLALTYDASGNPVVRKNASGTQKLTWDDDNRLVAISGFGANQRNVYDASGNRVVRNGAGHTIFADPRFEFDTQSTGTKHIFAGTTRVASVPSSFASGVNPTPPVSTGSVYYLHQTHLSSVGVVTTATGSVNDAHEYFPDGAAWIDSGISTTVDGLLFSAKPFDRDTKLYDYGQRFYDPRLSMWIGNDAEFRDAPSVSIGKPATVGVANYAANNPLRYSDPDGRTLIEDGRPVMSPEEKLAFAEYYVADELLREAGTTIQQAAQDLYEGSCYRTHDLCYGGSIESDYFVLEYIPPVKWSNLIYESTGMDGKRRSNSNPTDVLQVQNIPMPPGSVGVNTSGAPGKTKGWRVGDDHNAPTYKGTPPKWSTIRTRYWKNQAADQSRATREGSTNAERMKRGRAPQRLNTDAPRGVESKELSHEPEPQRRGGKDFVERWPQEHALVDPWRKPGY